MTRFCLCSAKMPPWRNSLPGGMGGGMVLYAKYAFALSE